MSRQAHSWDTWEVVVPIVSIVRSSFSESFRGYLTGFHINNQVKPPKRSRMETPGSTTPISAQVTAGALQRDSNRDTAAATLTLTHMRKREDRFCSVV